MYISLTFDFLRRPTTDHTAVLQYTGSIPSGNLTSVALGCELDTQLKMLLDSIMILLQPGK